MLNSVPRTSFARLALIVWDVCVVAVLRAIAEESPFQHYSAVHRKSRPQQKKHQPTCGKDLAFTLIKRTHTHKDINRFDGARSL